MTKMKKIAWAILFMFPIAAFTQEKVVVNDPNAQVRNVGSFSEISVSSSIDLYLTNDDKEAVVVSARDASYRDRIVTRVNGNRLEIYYDNKGSMKWTDMRLKAYVSFKQLKKLKASGSSDIYMNGVIKSDALELTLSGSSDFHGALNVNNLRLDQSGSSDSKISGKADNVDIDLSGASDVKSFDLTSNVCKVKLSGASDVSITVNNELWVTASGASDVKYKGAGVIKEIKTSGSSSVRKVE